MSYGLQSSKQDILHKVKEYCRAAFLHPSTIQWRKECRENQAFYNAKDIYNAGDMGQWTKETLDILYSRGQKPTTINLTQAFIDSICGVEIQGRYRTAYRSQSNKEETKKLAAALTAWSFHIQEDQRIPYKGSLKFQDAVITGIGVSNQYKQNGYFYDYVNSYNVIFDPDNLDPQYEGSRYVIRSRFMHPDYIKKMWPSISKYVDLSSSDCMIPGIESIEIMDRQSDYSLYDGQNFFSNSKGKIPVIEVQYRVPRKSYSGIDKNGYYFDTFDEKKAYDFSESENDIEEKNSERIMRTLFMGDFILEHAPLNPDLPNMKDFSYIPCVWKRRFGTGVCYGLMECIKDIQRDFNITNVKNRYLMNSSKVAITGNFSDGKTIDNLRSELKRNDSVVFLPEGTKIQFDSNSQLSKDQISLIPQYLMLMQRVTGIHDEMMGVQTNATSAIAQNVRQVNSVRNNVFAFSNFSNMKIRESKHFLDMFQGSDDKNVLVQILDNDQTETIILNLTREINGKHVISNDVRTFPVSLYVEEIPDYKSTYEEQRQMIQSLLSNANANWIMLSPKLMEFMGFREGEKISQEMRQAMEQKTELENKSNPVNQDMSPEMLQTNQSPLSNLIRNQ